MDDLPDDVAQRREWVRTQYSEAYKRRDRKRDEARQAQAEFEIWQHALDGIDFVISNLASGVES